MKNIPTNPTERMIKKLEELWQNYERVEMASGRKFEEEHPEIVPRTRLEEVWAWEDYAKNNSDKWLENSYD